MCIYDANSQLTGLAISSQTVFPSAKEAAGRFPSDLQNHLRVCGCRSHEILFELRELRGYPQTLTKPKVCTTLSGIDLAFPSEVVMAPS